MTATLCTPKRGHLQVIENSGKFLYCYRRCREGGVFCSRERYARFQIPAKRGKRGGGGRGKKEEKNKSERKRKGKKQRTKGRRRRQERKRKEIGRVAWEDSLLARRAIHTCTYCFKEVSRNFFKFSVVLYCRLPTGWSCL